MPNLTADRVKETTTTTGTGTVTLAGAVAQFRSFASAFADGSVVQYAIVGQTGTEWEVGNGTFTASGTTLARTTVLASSNANAAVNFSAGTKDVFATATASQILDPIVATLTASGAITAKAGTAAAPGIVAAGFSNSGFRWVGTGPAAVATGVEVMAWDLYARTRLPGSGGIFWDPVDTVEGTPDSGLARWSAGVLVGCGSGARVLPNGFIGGGAAVASAAALPLPTGRVFHVTGTTDITSITSTNFQSGVVVTLIFDGILTVTDGGNLKLAGNFVTAADSTLSLVYDGTNWFETSRSTN